MNTKLRKLILLSLLVAMTVLGANIKILGSIALDSFPAFIGTALLGPVFGLCLAFVGHMVSAYLAGFPLSLPIHLVIGVVMMITMYAYGWVRKREVKPNLSTVIWSNLVAYLGNVPLSLLAMVPLIGKEAAIGLFIPLTIATLANLAITECVFQALPTSYKTKFATL